MPKHSVIAYIGFLYILGNPKYPLEILKKYDTILKVFYRTITFNKECNMTFKIAIGTDNEKTFTDEHFGDSEYFLIYQYTDEGIKFIEGKRNIEYEEETHGDPKKANHISKQLKGIDVLIAKVFGPNIVRMKNKYVCVVSRVEDINEALKNFEGIIDKVIENIGKEEKSILYLE